MKLRGEIYDWILTNARIADSSHDHVAVLGIQQKMEQRTKFPFGLANFRIGILVGYGANLILDSRALNSIVQSNLGVQNAI